MLSIYFEDIYLLLPFLVNFIIIWLFYFKINFFSIRNLSLASDNKKKSDVTYTFHNSYFIFIMMLFLFLLISYMYTFKGLSSNVWWNHLQLGNLSFFIISLLLVVSFLFFLICKNVSLFNNFVKVDYFFSLFNLTLFLPLIFITNTLFTFLFVLEVSSVIVFYKFVVSKIWKLQANNVNDFITFRNLPNYYLNLLFFQYWATFFSSVLILFVLISYIYMYGSSEWFLLNLLSKFNLYFSLNNINLFVLNFILIFGFLIKIGFTPVHLYKIEVYKGLPFIAIFFYTTYYFLVFFLFFILLILFFLESFSVYWSVILLFILVFGLFYIISLIFDVQYVKAFFAYSSVINSVGFISVVVSILNY